MSGGGSLALQPAFFFGPGCAYTTQYSSLPRHSRALNTPFQRNTPARRSTGIPEHHLEYFVPRSVSEFNLAGVGDLALPPSRRCSPTESSAMAMELSQIGLQMGPSQGTLLCGQAHATLQPQTSAIQATVQQPALQLLLKPREKMVTFEDESKSIPLANSPQQHAVSSCHHRIASAATPLSGNLSRKTMTGTEMSFM